MTSQRTDFISLPSIEEINKIITLEARREVSEQKKDLHYVDFSSIVDLLGYYDLSASFFLKHFDFKDLTQESFLGQLNDSLSGLEVLLLDDSSTKPIELLNKVYAYLSEEDEPQQSDLIFVFGAKTPARAEKAVELYHLGLAPLICVSGSGPFYKNDTEKTEAEIYAQILFDNGVPQESIILEKESITIPDNIRSSLNLFDAKDLQFQSFILVNSPYVQRRGFVHFQKYTPVGTKIYRVNSKTIDKYSQQGWYVSSDGIRVVINEFVKMKIATSLNTA